MNYLIVGLFISVFQLSDNCIDDLLAGNVSSPDVHITTDTIEFEDMTATYTIVTYKDHGRLIQLDVDKHDSVVGLDFILWDADEEKGLDAIRYYDDEQRKYVTKSLIDQIDEEAIFDYHIQIEEVWFPSYYRSSDAIAIPLKPIVDIKNDPIWKKIDKN